MDYPNFYENIAEARMRLCGTVVLYDGYPYNVLAITDHMGPIFRIYLQPLDREKTLYSRGAPPSYNYSQDYPDMGKAMDEYIQKNPESGILRKHLDSPLFNRFIPFPLGMCNPKGRHAFYLQRQPNRHTRQGLTVHMVTHSLVSAAGALKTGSNIHLNSPEFVACILGKYPSPYTCLDKLKNEAIERDSVGFHRHFALIRGPVDTLFLGYKEDVVGVLPNRNFSKLELSRKHRHTKEVIEELKLFNQVV